MKVIPLPSQASLKEALDYNIDTGVFRWKIRPAQRIHIGDIAGKTNKYIQITFNKISYQGHRLAWMYVTGEDPGELEIDHHDNNPHNNAFINLRKATSGENSRNSRVQANNKLGIKGVSKQRNRYIANITLNDKTYYLGSYDTPQEAHKAYCDAADKLHGDFKNYG